MMPGTPAEDRRFKDPAWLTLPFKFYRQSYSVAEAWGAALALSAPWVAPEGAPRAAFQAHQWLDLFSPSNAPWANPEILEATRAQGAGNLVRGFANYLADLGELLAPSGAATTGFAPGEDVAATPGKIVFRNELIELIQYAPVTAKVRAEPILIVPAWIMKYYILDLSPGNSLVRYLTGQGHTVFCISWRNPREEMRDLPFDAYRSDGLMAALDQVSLICGGEKVHACGYCLGGTLLAIAAAAMARDKDDRLASVTLLAAQTDFSEPGEIEVFVSEDQVASLETAMESKGYLEGRQMGAAFALLRSRDLIWGRSIRNYWLGERDKPNDLMAWNSDTTRMPARMHSEYLRAMFLGNDLAEGRHTVEGAPVSLDDISAPLFVVSTETDHVAPWRSVYKLSGLTRAEFTFVLTSGGHNAGIVSEPGHAHRHFRIAQRAEATVSAFPDEWVDQAELRDGSWWLAWAHWLDERSNGKLTKPPRMGGAGRTPDSMEAAPGRYVMQR
jgi:poly[(R)-3-hydroxyalkanoate] polymerase subunit PhaC